MSDTIKYGAEWSSDASRDRMSPALQARCAAADAMYDRQSAAEHREQAERLAARREVDVMLSIRQAQDRGELVDIRKALKDGGVGHTPAEFIALASARSDFEDAQERGREQARIRKFLADGDGSWADTSAPTPAEAEEREVMVARAEKFRAGKRERGRMVRNVLAAARMDREDLR
jgi:hypothetical protein